MTTTNIIDGKARALEVREGLRVEVSALKTEHNITPGLAVVLVGEDPASAVYVRNKSKACEKAGIKSFQHTLEAEITEETLLFLIERLNEDARVDGILVQLPLPDHIDEDKVLQAIRPEKDVDGFHPFNVGRLITGKPVFEPCTPMGIMDLIASTGIDLKGKDAVVIGRSNIVGKPMAMMLLAEHATVTIVHSRTQNLPDKVKAADVIVAAVGIANFVKGDWVKDDAVVIDVGINRLDDGTLTGDVDFAEVSKKAAYITPVPGGVGPMTIAMLLKNTVKSAKRRIKN